MTQYLLPADLQAGGSSPDRPILVEPDRGPLRHLLIGDPALVRQVIRQIHLRQYQVDMLLWSPLLAIPETSLLIPPIPARSLPSCKSRNTSPLGQGTKPRPPPPSPFGSRGWAAKGVAYTSPWRPRNQKVFIGPLPFTSISPLASRQ